MDVYGSADSRFRTVLDAFRENFRSRGELGAALAVYVGGHRVVDLWGGLRERHTTEPWERDAVALIFSATKGITAICAHLLQQRGQLDLDAPVARYWPEFAAAGKEAIPTRMLLNHQAGLAAIDAPLPPEALYDWSRMTGALAAQAPNWSPGNAHGYHAMTFGFLVGEVVRRVSGRTLGNFFAEELARPLDLDLWIGLPAALEPRVVPIRMPPMQAEPSLLFRTIARRETLTSKAFMNPRGLLSPGRANTRVAHAAEIPAANGMGTARALARLYAVLANRGELDGRRWFDAETIAAMGHVESSGDDQVLLAPTRFAAGFMKTMVNDDDNSVRFGPSPEAFGHVGAGGSFGMADPQAEVAIGYVMNQMGPGFLLNPRGQALIDAVYACLV